MAKLDKYISLALTTGGTISINALDNTQDYIATGVKTLSSNLEISGTGSFVAGQGVKIFYDGGLTLNGSTLTILGTIVPDSLASKKFVVEAKYDGSDWISTILPDISDGAILDESMIADNSITTNKIADGDVELDKIVSLGIGEIITSDDGSTNVVKSGTESQIPIVQDDNTIEFKSLSGDITIDKDGLVTVVSLSSSTLQTAWAAGNTIVIPAGNSNEVVIATNSASANALELYTNTAKYALYCVGDSPTAGAIVAYITGANNRTSGTNIYSGFSFGTNASDVSANKFIGSMGQVQTGAYVSRNIEAKFYDISSNGSTHTLYGIDSIVDIASNSASVTANFVATSTGTQTSTHKNTLFYGDITQTCSSATGTITGLRINSYRSTISDGNFKYIDLHDMFSSSISSKKHYRFHGINLEHRYEYTTTENAYGYGLNIKLDSQNALPSCGFEYGISITQNVSGSDDASSFKNGLYIKQSGTCGANTVHGIVVDATKINTTASTSYGVYVKSASGYSYQEGMRIESYGIYGLHIEDYGSSAGLYVRKDGTASGVAMQITSTAGASVATITSYYAGTSAALLVATYSSCAIQATTINDTSDSFCIQASGSTASNFDSYGISVNITNGGSGASYMGKFDGDIVVSGAVGGSQDKKLIIKLGTDTYYIPCHTA